MVRPEIRQLIKRGNITLAETNELRCNSYEWEAMIPALATEALIWRTEHAIGQLHPARVPARTYDEAVPGVYAPELIRRLKTIEERAKGLVDYWKRGSEHKSMSAEYRAALRDCSKELKEIIGS